MGWNRGIMRISLRLIPRIERNATLCKLGSTVWGRLLFVAIFCLLLRASQQPSWYVVGLPLAAIAAFPSRRRLLTALASTAWAFTYLRVGWELPYRLSGFGHTVVVPFGYLVLAVFYVLAAILIHWAGRRPDHWFFRRPVRNILLLYAALLMPASYLDTSKYWVHVVLVFLLIAGKYLWFLLYGLVDRKRLRSSSAPIQVGFYRPFWGSTNVPFPKGESYLAKIEAKTDLAFAVSQLKGIKLMVWAIVLMLARTLFDELVHGIPASPQGYWLGYHAVIPNLHQAMVAFQRGYPIERALCWFSVFANYADNIFAISIMGHVIVAGCRMAGFCALRNTYKPCLAPTVAEFYNRIYYYFKELLVDLFFYPAYFRYFKNRPRTRLFFATISAACFGNVLFHFFRDYQPIMALGFWHALFGIRVYFIYGLILGVAIGISQVRSLSRPRPRQSPLRVIPIVAFYSLLMILDDPSRAWSIHDYAAFILNLFTPTHP